MTENKPGKPAGLSEAPVTKLKIAFDEIATAFEASNDSLHFFIDTKENEITVLTDTDSHQEEFEKMDDERYIAIPTRTANENFGIMESFVYELAEEDFELAEKIHKTLEGRKPFRAFKDLLCLHPELRQKWFEFERETVRNEAINWLCGEGIELEGQKLTPDMEAVELDEDAVKNLSEDSASFKPRACLKCGNEQGLKARWFKLNAPVRNMFAEREVKRIMRDDYSVREYGFSSGEEGEFLTVAKCPKCGSEATFWDY